MSMPLSSGSFSSSSVRPARPPPKSVREGLLEVRVDRGEGVAEARVRGLVDALDRLVGLGDRVDQILCAAWSGTWRRRRARRTARSPSCSPARAGRSWRGARRWPPRRSSPRRRGRRRPRRRPPVGVGHAGLGVVVVLVWLGASARRMAAASGASALPLHLLDLGEHLVERPAPRRGTAGPGGSRSASAVARATSSSAASARTASSARRASRIICFLLFGGGLEHQRLVVGLAAPRRAVRRAARTPSSSSRWPSTDGVEQRARAGSRISVDVAPAGVGAFRARAPPPRAAPLRPPRAGARSTRPACCGAGLGGALAERLASSRASASRRWARPARLGARARRRAGAIDVCGFGLPGVERGDPLRARRWPRSHELGALRARRASSARRAASVGLDADDRLLLAMLLGRQAATAAVACGNRRVELRRSRRRARVSGVAVGRTLLAQFLDLALGRQNAARLGFGCRRPTDVGAAQTSPSSVATGSVDRRRQGARPRRSVGDDSASPIDGAQARAANGPADAHDLDEQRRTPSGSLRRRRAGRQSAGARHRSTTKPQRPASWLPHQREAGMRPGRGARRRRAEQVAEAGLDRALVARIDVEIVGQRALLADARRWPAPAPCARASPNSARRGVQLLERAQPRASAPASSCSRVADLRARAIRARSRALASSASRAALRGQRRVAAPPAQSAAAPRRLVARPRPRARARSRRSARLDLELGRASRRRVRAARGVLDRRGAAP